MNKQTTKAKLMVVSFSLSLLQFVCFHISGTNLSKVVRSALFKSLLRQDLAWYDMEENSVSALTTRLSVDAGLVQGVSKDVVFCMCRSDVQLPISQ